MIKNIVLSLFVISVTQSFGQTDTLNQRTSDGEKMGWWITYLDENLVILKDSIGATHCMYNYYSGKIFHYRYGKGLGSKKYPIQFPADESMKIGNYKLLNGDYITFDKKGNKHSVLRASEGILIDYKEYYKTGELKVEIIFSAECGAPLLHCIKEYEKDGTMNYDGYSWFPEKTLDGKTYNPKSAKQGSLDGKTYIINVTQIEGQKNDWSVDTLHFDNGNLVLTYMEKQERFFPAAYSTSISSMNSVKFTNFECHVINQSGAHLKITGKVEVNKIKGKITWLSATNNLKRMFSFEGILKE